MEQMEKRRLAIEQNHENLIWIVDYANDVFHYLRALEVFLRHAYMHLCVGGYSLLLEFSESSQPILRR
jgi:hypothetical protein